MHQPMRSVIDSIKTLYDLYAYELRGRTTNEKICSRFATQTSPWMRNQEVKMRQEVAVEMPQANRRTPNNAPKVLARRTLSRQENAGEPG